MSLPIIDRILKPLDAIEKVFFSFAMTSVFLMACLTTFDTLGRYFFNKPITGAFEITENYLMIFAVYFALGHSYKGGANVRITFFVSRLSSNIQLFVRYFVQLLSTLYIAFIAISTTRINLGRLDNVVELTQEFSMPIWPAYVIISLGLIFVNCFIFFDLWKVKSRQSGLFKESSEEAL